LVLVTSGRKIAPALVPRDLLNLAQCLRLGQDVGPEAPAWRIIPIAVDARATIREPNLEAAAVRNELVLEDADWIAFHIGKFTG
jgi:hypothetical protein